MESAYFIPRLVIPVGDPAGIGLEVVLKAIADSPISCSCQITLIGTRTLLEKAYSFRFYLTPEQESLLRRTLGCVRLVDNKALHLRTQAWYEKQERVGYAQTSSMLTHWKKQAIPGAQWTGIVSTIACEMLNRGLVEGVVCVQNTAEDRFQPQPILARTTEEILATSPTPIQGVDWERNAAKITHTLFL